MKKIKSIYPKIALLGLGLENQSLLKLLDKKNIEVDITICDRRQQINLPKINLKKIKPKYRLGANFNRGLGEFDLLFRSPGWPLFCPGVEEALKNNRTEISSPMNLFFRLCPSPNIIGITGTKGKGTTASLIYSILKADSHRTGKNVFLGGNIGTAPLSFLDKIKKDDYIVLELSSFQLEDLEVSPRFAVITNLFKEHLAPADPNNPNFHASLKKYWQAKLKIATQKKNKHLIINERLLKKIEQEKSLLTGKLHFFNTSNLISKLTGAYNRENIAAAVKLAQLLKVPALTYKKVIANFSNLEHRLEFVAKIGNVDYYDNSFSTTPESTILDLLSFSGDIVQIAGGADKGANFKLLAKTIKNKVTTLILLPGMGSKRLLLELKNLKFPKQKLHQVKDMAEAVLTAKKIAKAGTTVLLSTGCASFGIFKNYKERGDLFKKYVRNN